MVRRRTACGGVGDKACAQRHVIEGIATQGRKG